MKRFWLFLFFISCAREDGSVEILGEGKNKKSENQEPIEILIKQSPDTCFFQSYEIRGYATVKDSQDISLYLGNQKIESKTLTQDASFSFLSLLNPPLCLKRSETLSLFFDGKFFEIENTSPSSSTIYTHHNVSLP